MDRIRTSQKFIYKLHSEKQYRNRNIKIKYNEMIIENRVKIFINIFGTFIFKLNL